MLSRQHRFHGHGGLNFVYRRGATVRDASLALRFVRNQRSTVYRAAVIVSRKVDKSAVVRNRIRRRLYEVIRRHEAAITMPYDLVLTVFSARVADMPSDKLDQVVAGLLERAGVIVKS